MGPLMSLAFLLRHSVDNQGVCVCVCVWASQCPVSSDKRAKCLCNLIITSVCNRCQQLNRQPVQHLFRKLEVTHGRAVANNI